MINIIHPVLLCGGSGSRLWPLSRRSYPKQFVDLIGTDSLFQAAARRFSGTGFSAPSVVTGSDFRFMVVEQLAAIEIKPFNILIEPTARNTAAAICAAALSLHAQKGDSLMLVSPSDHVMLDPEGFKATATMAVPAALSGQIVTFGIRPDRAETGYGWLELTSKPSNDFPPVVQPLLSFVEKPDPEVAETLLRGGMHLWNSGVFLFTTSKLLELFEMHASETLSLTRDALNAARSDLDFTRLAAEPWSKLEDISIDYAVMERAKNLSVMPYGGPWSDLGDWDSIWRELGADDSGVVERGLITDIDCKNTLLMAPTKSQELVAIGVEDIIAVAMPDAVLVAHKDRAQDVKKAVSELKSKGAAQAETFSRDYRPWGWYERLALESRFQVKRIVVKPGALLSLQSHKHRSEHWVIVEGTAKITINDEVKVLTENQSVYVPVGAIHRLENPGKMHLTLIEVQTGSYFGEDDIIRYDDIYARGNDFTG